MLNGALTLGLLWTEQTLRLQKAGRRRQHLIFGEDSETVIDLYARSAYKSSGYYAREAIKPMVDFIVGDEVLAVGKAERGTSLQ